MSSLKVCKQIQGKTGLELESQRITPDGHLAQTDHPFPGSTAIDRDFGEAQTEINTLPEDSAEEALESLHKHLYTLQKRLRENGELLWCFSSPPAIRDASEIRIARYEGPQKEKMIYRQYLAEKYGRYKMTFAGIHYNYSFTEESLSEIRKCRESGLSWREWKDDFYLDLAVKTLEYSWMIVALLAASPFVDGSYFDKDEEGKTIDTGHASLRCSEQGYWNLFSPVLSYEDMDSYTESVEAYIRKGWLRSERELYYPVRVKPKGKYTLRNLKESGADHIELRLIDLNPFALNGIELRDLQFLELLLIWLAGQEKNKPDQKEQLRLLQNCKNGAGADWETPCILDEKGIWRTIREYTENVLGSMRLAFANEAQAAEVLEYQYEKVRHPEKRYARRVRELCGDDYLRAGVQRAFCRQEELLLGEPQG